MRCEQHKNYKGLQFPKVECAACMALYRLVNDNDLSRYKSVSTPEFYCGLNHLLAEVATIMNFGLQCPFFWRKASPSSKETKDFYKSIYEHLTFWNKQNPDIFKNIGFVFNEIYRKKVKREVANNIRAKQIVTKPSNEITVTVIGNLEKIKRD